MSNQMQHIVLASRPDGAPTPDNFRLESKDIPTPGAGEVLVEVQYMSLDPYMRGRMDDAKSYAAPVPIGGTMEGGSVGKVIDPNGTGLSEGDMLFGPFGWATHAVAEAKMCRKLDPAQASVTTSLGVLGMPGLTGWHGLMEYGRPKEGETLVVAAATMAVDHFGFDACIDHRAHTDAKSLRGALKEACPKGIDIYFENVGGKVLDAVLPLMNPFGRIPVCGMIAWYNAGGLGENAGGEGLTAPKLWRTILVNFLSVNGFIISNHWNRFPEFLNDIAPKVASGEIAVQEDITEGLENAPEAFIKLLTGGNTGKAIVKVA